MPAIVPPRIPSPDPDPTRLTATRLTPTRPTPSDRGHADRQPQARASITCPHWCLDHTGHPGSIHPGSIHPGDQRCRSTVHRIDTPLGGGHGTDQTTATAEAGLYLQAVQHPDQPPTYILGLELGGTEHWTRLRAGDLQTLITAARTLLSQNAER